MAMILNPYTPTEYDIEEQLFQELYVKAAELYNRMHARYVQTPYGLKRIRDNILLRSYGQCPRDLCAAQAVIPIGLTAYFEETRVKVSICNSNAFAIGLLSKMLRDIPSFA